MHDTGVGGAAAATANVLAVVMHLLLYWLPGCCKRLMAAGPPSRGARKQCAFLEDDEQWRGVVLPCVVCAAAGSGVGLVSRSILAREWCALACVVLRGVALRKRLGEARRGGARGHSKVAEERRWLCNVGEVVVGE